jgi:hypothetical protein
MVALLPFRLAYNGYRLAAVPAFIVRQLKFITKVQ